IPPSNPSALVLSHLRTLRSCSIIRGTKMSSCYSRKWLAFLVCAKLATAGLVFGASGEAERRLSAGVKIGGPVGDLQNDDGGFTLKTKRYTVGPFVNIRTLGTAVGDYILANALLPLHGQREGQLQH